MPFYSTLFVFFFGKEYHLTEYTLKWFMLWRLHTNADEWRDHRPLAFLFRVTWTWFTCNAFAEDGPSSSKRRRPPKKEKFVDCVTNFLSEKQLSTNSNDDGLSCSSSRSSPSSFLTTDLYCLHARGVVGTDAEGIAHELERPIRMEKVTIKPFTYSIHSIIYLYIYSGIHCRD